jgi:hypothetical protein
VTVYQLYVDGQPSQVFADLEDPARWVTAATAVESALAGRPVDVVAVPTKNVRADTNPIVHFNAQVLREDNA